MTWKDAFRKPLTALSGLAVCAGLLVDFQEAATKMGEVIPVMRGLLPTFAIGGVVFFGGWFVYILTIELPKVYRIIYFRLSGRTRLIELARAMTELDHRSLLEPCSLPRVRILLEELEKDGFCIPQRPEHWEYYFVYLSEYLFRYDKKRVINVSKELVAALQKMKD